MRRSMRGEVRLWCCRRGIGAHHDVQARVARAGNLRVALDARAAEAGARDLLDALAHLGVVAIARHVHQAGVEAVVGIAPHQQSHRAPLVEIDHAAHDADQVRDPGLEQLIARIGLEHVEHRLAVVACRVEAEVLDDRARPCAAAPGCRAGCRDRRWRSTGRGSGARRSTRPRESKVLTPDVVEQLGAMHGGGRVRLGDDQQLRLARLRAHIAAQHRGRGGAPLRRAALRSPSPERTSGTSRSSVLPRCRR